MTVKEMKQLLDTVPEDYTLVDGATGLEVIGEDIHRSDTYKMIIYKQDYGTKKD